MYCCCNFSGVQWGDFYCSLVDSRCRDFIHCCKLTSVYRPPDPQKCRSIAAHSGLGEPREAYPQIVAASTGVSSLMIIGTAFWGAPLMC